MTANLIIFEANWGGYTEIRKCKWLIVIKSRLQTDHFGPAHARRCGGLLKAVLRQRADEATRNENIGCAVLVERLLDAPTRWTAHTSLSSPPSAPVSRDEQWHQHDILHGS